MEIEGGGAENERQEGKSGPLERSQHFRCGVGPPQVPRRQDGWLEIGWQGKGVIVVS